jgi:hypothetical protein
VAVVRVVVVRVAVVRVTVVKWQWLVVAVVGSVSVSC